MLYERRQAKRVPVQFEVRWQGEAGLDDGLMSDISAGGCFVLTSGRVAPRELIRLELMLPSGSTLTTWGVVVEHCPEIGFSLRFTGLADADRSYVETIVERASRRGEESQRRAVGEVKDVILKF